MIRITGVGGSHTNKIETDDIPDLDKCSQSSDSSDDSDYEDDSSENEDENSDEYSDDEHESKTEITGVDAKNDIDNSHTVEVGGNDNESEIHDNV